MSAGFGADLNVEESVDWDSVLVEEIMCEEPDPSVEHPAEVYVQGKCSHCPNDTVRAVCRKYAAFVLALPGLTKCRSCKKLTPMREFYTVLGEVGK